MREQDIFIDKVEQGEESSEVNYENPNIFKEKIQMMEGFGFHWPYITMKAFDNHQMIINIKDPNLIINIELDPNIN